MTVTNNYSLTLPTVGGDTNAWGALLNNGVTTVLDSILGGNLAVSMSSSNVNITASQFQNLIYTITGTLTTNLNLTIPLSPNSGAVACAGAFIVNNQTTGAYTITVLTVAAGSTGVAVPQGYRSFLYSDGTNVQFNDDQVRSSILSNAGDPNGSVSGTAGSVNTPSSLRFDRSNGILYVCTTTGTAWAGIATGNVVPQGYLTLNSDPNVVITTSDVVGGTTLYYSPLVGNLLPISNGTYFGVRTFSQLSLPLTTSQASGTLYDVFAFSDSGTIRIGVGPSWTAGGGSTTARGTGAGSTALTRLNGLLVNAVAITATNNLTNYSVGQYQATYLGTISMDNSAGHITCYTSTGQNRKWGVWNYYNRHKISLNCYDPTASWVYNTAAWRVSNNTTANSLQPLMGMNDEPIFVSFAQNVNGVVNAGNAIVNMYTAIGVGSTSSPSGKQGNMFSNTNGSGGPYLTMDLLANYNIAAGSVLGALNIYPLENSATPGTAITYYGNSNSMLLRCEYNG